MNSSAIMTNMRGSSLDRPKVKIAMTSALGRDHQQICLISKPISNFLSKGINFNLDSIPIKDYYLTLAKTP